MHTTVPVAVPPFERSAGWAVPQPKLASPDPRTGTEDATLVTGWNTPHFGQTSGTLVEMEA
ncbi:MAG TPA: hypothetical protein VMS00_11435 [Acidimicrobiales bacterium]|nr:hypothetical protein [Acidimicrobiales bacterium]